MADLSNMCSFVMMQINTFLDDELDEDAANEVREHITACESCMDELEIWVGIRSALKRACPPDAAPAGLLSKVTSKIRELETAQA